MWRGKSKDSNTSWTAAERDALSPLLCTPPGPHPPLRDHCCPYVARLIGARLRTSSQSVNPPVQFTSLTELTSPSGDHDALGQQLPSPIHTPSTAAVINEPDVTATATTSLVGHPTPFFSASSTVYGLCECFPFRIKNTEQENNESRATTEGIELRVI